MFPGQLFPDCSPPLGPPVKHGEGRWRAAGSLLHPQPVHFCGTARTLALSNVRVISLVR